MTKLKWLFSALFVFKVFIYNLICDLSIDTHTKSRNQVYQISVSTKLKNQSNQKSNLIFGDVKF